MRLVGLHPEIVVRIRLKVMLQILLDHLIGHLPNRSAEVASHPKVPASVPLLDVRKLLKQSTRRSPIYTPHDLTRPKGRRGTHQYAKADRLKPVILTF